VLVLVVPRQIQILVRCLLCLLDESMQQDHPAQLVDIEKHPRDSVLSQVRSHFKDAVSQWPASRHPDGPAELHCLDVLPDALAILG